MIGKELIGPLLEAGFDVNAITADEHNADNGVHWHRGNLFDERFVRDVMSEVKPTHLLNMAWATTGDYLVSELNYRFLAAGIGLARAFYENGGRRAVYAGTCFEYKIKDAPLCESDELDPGKFTYTFCKDALRRIVGRFFGERGISFGYGRIFYVYGRNEAKSRLTGMVVDKLLKGERITIKAGPLVRDYMYSKDIAAAFSALVAGEVEGCVNVCSGKGVSIRDFVTSVASAMGRTDLVAFEDDCEGQPKNIIGDNRRLVEEVGWKQCWHAADAIQDILRAGA